MLSKLQRAAERGEAVHEVEETTWSGLIEMGREMIVGYIKKQEEDVPRPKVIEHAGKKLHRLPRRRRRPYVSAFGPTPFWRDVYAERETQRQEVVPLDAKLGMPEGNTSYLLQKWSGTKCVKESYQESRATLLEILGFAPSVNCLEDLVARAAEHAEVYFDQQEAVDPTTEEEILVATSDCKGVPMRHVDAPRRRQGDDVPRPKGKRLKKGEKNGQKRMACVGGVYSVAPFRRTADDVLNEILRQEKQERRPKPQNKRLRAVLTRQVDDQEVNAKDVVFDWLAQEVRQRDPQKQRTVVAIMDGETKLRDLQELNDWPGDRHLGHLARDRIPLEAGPLFSPRREWQGGSVRGNLPAKAAAEGNVGRVIGGIRQMATKGELSKHKCEKLEQYLSYFADRREYMKYDEYLAAGYPIGSGVVEGACRHLVKDRMEQTGMRWRIAGPRPFSVYEPSTSTTTGSRSMLTESEPNNVNCTPTREHLPAILNCASLTRSGGCNQAIWVTA